MNYDQFYYTSHFNYTSHKIKVYLCFRHKNSNSNHWKPHLKLEAPSFLCKVYLTASDSSCTFGKIISCIWGNSPLPTGNSSLGRWSEVNATSILLILNNRSTHCNVSGRRSWTRVMRSFQLSYEKNIDKIKTNTLIYVN